MELVAFAGLCGVFIVDGDLDFAEDLVVEFGVDEDVVGVGGQAVFDPEDFEKGVVLFVGVDEHEGLQYSEDLCFVGGEVAPEQVGDGEGEQVGRVDPVVVLFLLFVLLSAELFGDCEYAVYDLIEVVCYFQVYVLDQLVCEFAGHGFEVWDCVFGLEGGLYVQ